MSTILTLVFAVATMQGWPVKIGNSTVYRVVDAEHGVACYVIPQDHCVGDCAYSPAISCVKTGVGK